ncbi:MAG: hypothetical protein H6839_06715 [Planctomycetes bacterium]|nr:hypothetical protein [Planctomycetota bacterium]
MSYALPRFLTVIFVLSTLIGGSLSAQRDIVTRELPDLASPSARERAQAAVRLAAIKDDISGDLRVAYKFADNEERMGLLLVAQLRHEDALVDHAAEALGSDDERLVAEAREYLLSLPFDALAPDVSKLDDDHAAAWQEFQDFRIRRDISAVLLEAHLKPGKFFSQFDGLRSFDTARLDRELLAVMRADPVFTEPLNLASAEAIAGDYPPEVMFQAPYRRLTAAAGAFEPALLYQRKMEGGETIDRAVREVGEGSYLAAQEVLVGLRAAAVRALADSPATADLRDDLNETYDALLTAVPPPPLARVIDLDQLRVELELTLARFGDRSLLDARIESLRSQIDRVQQAKANVNMQVASRPDLIAQNEIAHLMLRAGDIEGAEKEWADAVTSTREMLREVDGRNRTSLSSYLAAVFYNLACAQSLQGKVSKALVSLKEAVRYGYKDFGWMLEDGDLYQVRETASFSEWFEDTAPPAVADRLGDRP